MEKKQTIVTGMYKAINTNDIMVTIASPVFINGKYSRYCRYRFEYEQLKPKFKAKFL